MQKSPANTFRQGISAFIQAASRVVCTLHIGAVAQLSNSKRGSAN